MSVRVDPGGHEIATTVTRNACRLCTPLGACLAFRGVSGCVPFLHGSQGCATYIRRYLISHFREPIDIASSNFHEEAAVFGGAENLGRGLDNVLRQYEPSAVGLATTCLAETIGEDTARIVADWAASRDNQAPVVHVSTPSYRGTHVDGFHAAVAALVDQLAAGGPRGEHINLLPGMLSPADQRHLMEIVVAFDLHATVLPDYSETLDGETWLEYEKLPAGGTKVADIERMGRAVATIECGRCVDGARTAGSLLAARHGVVRYQTGMPIGVGETDRFVATLKALAGRPAPAWLRAERGRLVDSLIDAHKYVFEKRAVVFGDEDLVIGLTAFLCETGITPVLVATGGRSRRFERCLREAAPDLSPSCVVRDGCDFGTLAELSAPLAPDVLLASSKGYRLTRTLGLPLVRVGFPIHDRIGGGRVLHVGYRGAQQLFDRVVNALLEHRQDHSDIGYSYL